MHPAIRCRYRESTSVVPPGRFVHGRWCPGCGRPLAYREAGGAAWRLHPDDPRFILSVVE